MHQNYQGIGKGKPMPNMGSVYQRKDGNWCAAVWLNGRRKTLYGKTEKEAKKKLAGIQSEIATSGTLAKPGTRTVDDLLSQWLDTVKSSLKPRTFSEYEGICNRHIRPAIGRVRLGKLEPSHLQKLSNFLVKDGKHRQAQFVYSLLHRALTFAQMWGWLADNPAERVFRPKYIAARKEVWNQEQLASFLDGTKDSWLHPLWTVALASGARLGELLGLKWEHSTCIIGNGYP